MCRPTRASGEWSGYGEKYRNLVRCEPANKNRFAEAGNTEKRKEKKMSKKSACVLVLVLLAAAMIFAGGGQEAAGGGKKVVLRLGGIQPVEDPSSQGMARMAAAITEKSGGSLDLQTFPASQLGNATSQMEAVSMGSQEMFLDASGFVGTFLKDRQIDAMFFIFRDAAHYKAFMESDLNKALEEDFRKLKGIRILCSNWYRAPRSFVAKTPFNAQTFVGMKVRVPDIKGYLESIAAIGGKPTQIAWGETYLALQQGVVDAAEGPADSLYTMKFYEAAKNVMVTNHIRDCLELMINDKIWGGLSAEHQKLLVDAGREAGDWYTTQINTVVESAFKGIRDGGGTITEIDVGPLREKVSKRIEEIEAEGSMWRKGLYKAIQDIK
jgi:TRAP-type C4-dicarboxylate transport system substrate-binding protein